MRMSEAAAGSRFAKISPPLAACRKAALAQDRYAPGGADHAPALAKAVLAWDQDAPAGADHALALASCRATAAKAKAAKATATVDDSMDPGHRRHCDHERPSGAHPGAPHPAKLAIARKHSFNRCYAALPLGAVIACRFFCRNTPTQHLLVCHGLPGLIPQSSVRLPTQ